jgi:DNA repair protein RadC
MSLENSNHFGHRRRLRRRFDAAGRQALADHELLELLLAYAIPRRDTKPPARELLNRFGSLAGVLFQPPERLREVPGVGESSATLFRLVRELFTRLLESDVDSGRRISAPEDVADYVRLALGPEPRECVMILCLNAANRLVHRTVVSEGTVNQAPVYTREVARLALLHGAVALILIHNHPSGQALPSSEDLALTRQLTDALAKLDIRLHDHLIVTPSSVYSIMNNRLVHPAVTAPHG